MISIINTAYLVLFTVIAVYSVVGMLLCFFKKDGLRNKFKMTMGGDDFFLFFVYTVVFCFLGTIDNGGYLSIGVSILMGFSSVAFIILFVLWIYKWHTNLKSS